MDDWQLLHKYAAENSEEAFRALVERYSGMVYHTALRQTGNPHAAEEASQVVFIALARKAGAISKQATLYGWLFRATRFAVLNHIRQNATRAQREKESITMPSATDPNNSIWEEISPHLNDALEDLSSAEREAVMIRYFGNKSHKDVAEALGISEESARQRVSRALEKLRHIFARRGVAVSSVALAGAFAAHGAKAAPLDVSSAWAKVAMTKAAGATAVNSSAGILKILTPAKIAAGLGGLALLGVVSYEIFKPVSPPAALPRAMAAATGPVPSPPAAPMASNPPAKPAKTAVPASALDKVRAALHDPNPTAEYPNAAMQSALAGLADNKIAALPLLEEGLADSNSEVRLRAVDGIGLIGPSAGGAAPLLLQMLREGGLGDQSLQPQYRVTQFGGTHSYPIYPDNILLYSLAAIHPAPGALAELARAMKENRTTLAIVYHTSRQFEAISRTPQAGGWLYDIAGGNARALNQGFLPLLQDSDRGVRAVSALILVSALGDQADRAVFPIADELLKSDDDPLSARDGMTILDGAARDLGSNAPAVADPVLYAPRLGPYLNETVSALAHAAYHAPGQRLRLRASTRLNVLLPDFRKANPELAAALEKQSEMEAFVDKVRSADASIAEIRAGLKKFPKSAPDVAGYYARMGAGGAALLPDFAQALATLAPAPELSAVDHNEAINERLRLADAMQKIAPDQPKPLFTSMDVRALNKILNDPGLSSDRAQQISNACQTAGWPARGIFDASPDQVRHLLAALKDADAAAGNALSAKVNDIDPHFFDAPPTQAARN